MKRSPVIIGIYQPARETFDEYVHRIQTEPARNRIIRQTEEHADAWADLSWIQDAVSTGLMHEEALTAAAGRSSDEWLNSDVFLNLLAQVINDRKTLDLNMLEDLFITTFIRHYKEKRSPAIPTVVFS